MSVIQRKFGASGTLKAKKLGARKAPWLWRLSNAMKFSYLRGWLAFYLVRPIASAFGLMTVIGALSIRVKRANGEWIDYGVVSYRVITNAGVTFLRDDFNNGAAEISNMNYHGLGTGNTAEAAGDTALVTESTTALNPDSTRATGTRSTPASNQFQSVGTLTFDAGASIVEHGLFSQAATGGGTLWDRSIFSVITMGSGDSLQSTYVLTLTAGG